VRIIFPPCFNGFAHGVNEIWVGSVPVNDVIAALTEGIDEFPQVLTRLIRDEFFEHGILLHCEHRKISTCYCARTGHKLHEQTVHINHGSSNTALTPRRQSLQPGANRRTGGTILHATLVASYLSAIRNR